VTKPPYGLTAGSNAVCPQVVTFCQQTSCDGERVINYTLMYNFVIMNIIGEKVPCVSTENIMYITGPTKAVTNYLQAYWRLSTVK
jgi:hypothetical protein